MLIDDNLTYALQCAKDRIPVILFGSYAWNQPESLAHLMQSDDSHAVHEVPSESFVIVEFEDHLSFHRELTSLESQADELLVIPRATSWRHVLPMVQTIHPVVFASELDVKAEGNESVLNIAVVQLCSSNNKQRNFTETVEMIKLAVHCNPTVTLVCLPECSAFVGASANETLSAAEIIPPPNSAPEMLYPNLRCTLLFDSEDVSTANQDTTLRDESADNRNGVADVNYVAGLCELANIYKIWISVGGFPEKNLSDSEGKLFNTHLVIDPTGRIVHPVYRKIHLFDHPQSGLMESRITSE